MNEESIFKLFINYQIKRKHSATKILTMMYTSYGKVVYENKKCFKSFANCIFERQIVPPSEFDTSFGTSMDNLQFPEST
jgi:hypothetical protein